MQAHIIVAGSVSNTIEVDSLEIAQAMFPEATIRNASLGGAIGDSFDEATGTYTSPPRPLPTEADYVTAIQSMLDAKAQDRRYDSILSACTYAASANPKFQAEGQACVAWRDAVWAKCYDVMAKVQAGTIPQPTIPELMAMLPTMAWPA